MIEIQNGCTRHPNKANTWIYTNMLLGPDRRDQVKMEEYEFTAQEDERPEIGDFIQNGSLVKRTTPKVNSDWSRWKDKDLYGEP